LTELFGVTDEQAEIASRRFTIRKTRERNAVIFAAVVAPILMVSGAALDDILDPQSFLDYVVYWLSILAISAPCAYALRRWLNGEENRLFQEELKGPEY